MIPEAFTYERAGSVAEALEHMGRGALPLAGGHSLVPALKLRLSAPEALVDIARIPELTGIRVDGGTLVIGACTRHRVVAESADVAAQRRRRWRRPAAEIGDQLVRNRGTIGGSLAQADPHGDLPAVALALGAEIVVAERVGHAHDRGRRLLRRLLHDRARRGRADHGDPHPRRPVAGRVRQVQPAHAQDWALIGAAVSKGAGGWRVALCGAAPTAVRAAGVEAALAAGASAADASAHAGEGISPEAEPRRLDRVQAPPRGVMVRRALEAAGA